MKQDKEKLRMWQERLKTNESAYSKELAQMDHREELYRGQNRIRPIVRGEREFETPHVRNIVAEMIESQVNSTIPQPKVTAKRKEDELKAKLIEDMIRNELDRMPMEVINDMMERTVPIQGGAGLLIEWDNTQSTHTSIGEIYVGTLHPKQIIPQAGVFTGVEDMDYIFLKVPQTKEYIRRQYGVTVEDENESEPDIRGGDTAQDMVTQYIAYYRNDNGGIGKYSWVNDQQLEDIEDYQARILRRCKKCGAIDNGFVENMGAPLQEDGNLPYGVELPEAPDFTGATEEKPRRGGKSRKVCPYCGSTQWEETTEEYEELMTPLVLPTGEVLPVTEKVPYYKPDRYPVIIQKNVSSYGRFLGESDVDKIEPQQNTTNRLSVKIIEKLVKSGSYISLPEDCHIKYDAEDMKIIRPRDAASMSMIQVFDMEGNVTQDMNYLYQVYEEARQAIGVTDSFQGRKDTTATSGTAKQFAAAQAAGRLESKRVMKDAAYADLFRAIFQFKLAYTDEEQPVVSNDVHGNPEYKTFNRYDFLEKDAAGEWYWNDQFLFSCDTSAPLAQNREAMWQEQRLNLQSGAFGDPTQIGTLLLFWQKMEMLHYPGASETRAYLEEEYQRQQEQMQQQMAMQLEQMRQQAAAQRTVDNQQIMQQQQQAAAQEAERQAKKSAQQARQGMGI